MREMGKADTHVHTEYSGVARLGVMKFPESVTTPAQQVDCARKNGMDVLCITDHDEIVGALKAKEYAKKYDDIEVVIGEEITTADGEIIGLFLNEPVPDGLSAEETIEIVRSQGGLTIAPHPFSIHVAGLQEKIFSLDIDGFEVMNGGHVDAYSNNFAKIVMEKHPGRWAPISGSDAHSVYTTGYNWTEFEGNTAEDFRKAVIDKKTIAVGNPAPVFGELQWSMEVVWGGQKMMYLSISHRLPDDGINPLVTKINSLTKLKKATGIICGAVYVIPPVCFLATWLSTSFLNRGAKRMQKTMQERLDYIDTILMEIPSNTVESIEKPI
ncbi:MAG TPA: PHP domain-containing protein [Candidatus Methanomethylophilaceae archaeon]|nr:PHP domain-containing protein [Candidatus Methanomethylophilaceae archaeon]